MDSNELKNMVFNFSIPPQVETACFIKNGTRRITAVDWDEFKHFFDWVNENDIQQRVIRLKGITLGNEKSIIAIYGDSQKIIEFERKSLNFEPPLLSTV
jgi:hypothetical protein